jgi:DNA end-binding protein Ku
MARPSWEGNLRLSLVMCPVALYNATSSSGDVRFNLLHKDTHNRIRMIPHDPELGEVSRGDLVKGYEVERGNYVILSEEEIKSVRIPSSRTIEIEKFVDETEIDRVYWDNPYYVVPSEKTATEAFCVIRDAMREARKVALGRVTMHTRERLIAIEARDRGMLLTTLRTRDEVRAQEEYFDEIPKTKADKKMIDIAQRIIEQQEGGFDPSVFTDRYEDALRELVAAKQKGRKIVAAAAPEPEKVIDLMAALKKSLESSGGAPKSRAERFVKARGGAGSKAQKETPSTRAAGTRRKPGRSATRRSA